MPAEGPAYRVIVDEDKRFWFELPSDWKRRSSGMTSVPHNWRPPDGRIDLRVLLVSSIDASAVAEGDVPAQCSTMGETLRAADSRPATLTLSDARRRDRFATCTFVLEYAASKSGAPIVVHHVAFGATGTVSLVLETDRRDWPDLRALVSRIVASFVLR